MPETEREGKVRHFMCMICGARYPTLEQAKECESKGFNLTGFTHKKGEEIKVRWPKDKDIETAEILNIYPETKTHKIMCICYIASAKMWPHISADKIVK